MTILLSPVPDELVAQVRAFAAEGRTPVTPRDASSVVLMREGAEGPEVYLIRRRRELSFAAGFHVFPGGGVDPRDFDTAVAWGGPDVATWARAFRCDEPVARALVCAAVRETFEESGVLLAGPDEGSVVSDLTDESWERDRRALEAHELPLTEFLRRRSLVLRTDLLQFWAHWTTPDWEPRRFDTRFFVATLPAGQVTRDVSTESDKVVWLPATRVVASAEAGELAMLPPTFVNCSDVAGHATAAEVMHAASRRTPRVVQPVLVTDDGPPRLQIDQFQAPEPIVGGPPSAP